jgi:DNA-directed RNA polymerase subunit omega
MRDMDSRYTLVVTVSKRARQLTDGAEPLTRFHSDKPVTLAIHEIAEGKVEHFRDAGANRQKASVPSDGAQRIGELRGSDLYDDGVYGGHEDTRRRGTHAEDRYSDETDDDGGLGLGESDEYAGEREETDEDPDADMPDEDMLDADLLDSDTRDGIDNYEL